MISIRTALAALAVITAAAPAQAAVTISTAATQNMSCSGGACTPTASDAVLNVSDVENLLASGSLTVTTTGSGVQANDIGVTAAFSWSTGSRLSLQAYESVNIAAAISVAGDGGLALTINDGGTHGLLSFISGGDITFQNPSSELTITGKSYTLVNSIATLASAIANNPKGYYALANAYDAGNDGTYSNSPVGTTFSGAFEGLGNTISNLTIANDDGSNTGLFASVTYAALRHIELANANVSTTLARIQNVGALAGDAENSTIDQAYVIGTVSARSQTYIGGLFGYTVNDEISRCFSAADVYVSGGDSSVVGGLIGNSDTGDVVTGSYALGNVSAGNRTAVGGLIGQTRGTVKESYATGSVSGKKTSSVGGLIGGNSGTLVNVYASGSVSSPFSEGGLVGYNITTVAKAYSTGALSGGATYRGGLIGYDYAVEGNLSKTYWDTKTSDVNDPSQGAGNIANDSGIKGKTTKQFQSGLPTGFDPKIWAENPNINNGLPYLVANPPPK